MHLDIPNTFSKTMGVQRVKQGLVEARPQMKDQVVIEKEEWVDNTLNFAFLAQKQRITGTLVVEDNKFIIDAKLPLMWRLFEGRIEKAVSEQLKLMQK